MKPVKPKKCKFSECGKQFKPWSSTQQTCHNPTCAFGYDREKKAKKEKRQLADDRKVFKLNCKKTQRNLSQKAFNRFIRLRDAGDGCISCGSTKFKKADAGHYRSIGATRNALRYHEDNCHLQCSQCNSPNDGKSGNIVEYRINLIKKIGEERLAWLESYHEPVTYTAEDYVAIKKKYLAMGNELEGQQKNACRF